MKRILVAAAITGSVSLGLAAPAFALRPPTSPGMPNQQCGGTGATSEPGNGSAASSPGSVFNEPTNGFSTSPGTANATYNAIGAPSQYDVACFQVTSNP